MKDLNTVDLTEDVIREWLRFDKHNLDEEFLVFPMQIYRLGVECAQAFTERDRAKQNLEVEKSATDLLIRKSPVEYGLEKITEVAVANIVATNPKIIKLQNTFLEANEKLAYLEAGRYAMRDKLTAMTMEVKLYESSYFADGKMPKGAKEMMGDAGKREQEKVLNRDIKLKGGRK